MGEIFELLKSLGSASMEARRVFAERTRDAEGLRVYRDDLSGVVYIDDFYVGDQAYQGGQYRDDRRERIGSPEFERYTDCTRRVNDYRQFIAGKDVLDFGCGDGHFLLASKELARSVQGVEIEERQAQRLTALGVQCSGGLPQAAVDSAFLLHVAEHLPRPIETLQQISAIIRPGGTLVVEVPHANDLLLQDERFRAFSLWSQHLVLHTRESLRRLLAAAGFRDTIIQGKQRYPLSNHLHWLLHGKPGGHKKPLSVIDTPALRSAYEASLQHIDATDTLVAIATKA